MTHSSPLSAALDDLARELCARRAEVLAHWRTCVDRDPEISGSSHMTRAQFYDHIPMLLETFSQRLYDAPDTATTPEAEAQENKIAHQHSQHRWQQGYSVRSLVREWGHLNSCMTIVLESVEAPAPAIARARLLWAEFVNQNISEGVAEYESLLQSEARVRLQDLEKALQTMSALEMARAQMLREVSHDLRGGLSVVAGASSLLGKENIGETDRAHVLTMLQSGVRSVTQMISDLMDMSRLEAGQENRVANHVDAAQVLLDLCDHSKMLAEEKGLWLRTSGPELLPIHGDSSKVRRIAQNLLLNALKYTQQGGVTVSWGEVSDKQWFLSVSDTGPGFEASAAAPLAKHIAEATEEAVEIGAQAPQENDEPEKHKKHSVPQVQSASTPNTLSAPGEGIGLSIVRRLCELLDATLELESEPGKGSTFRVTFPRAYTG